MADVTIEIGGRRYDVACRDGEEEQLRRLSRLVDEKAAQARAAVGGVNETRQLLFAALLLADELNDARNITRPSAPSGGGTDDMLIAALERLAGRVESVAEALEGNGVTS